MTKSKDLPAEETPCFIFYSPCRVSTDQGVTVERYEPDFEQLAWQTLNLLIPAFKELALENPPRILKHPGTDADIARILRDALRWPFLFGTVYANPCGTVRSELATAAFLRKARQLQSEWFKRFNDTLGSANNVRSSLKEDNAFVRQLIHTGVMIIDDQHLFPNRWPSEPPFSSGTRHGLLVVVKLLSEGNVLCRCDCGKEVVHCRRHLITGGARSCGCHRAKRNAPNEQ